MEWKGFYSVAPLLRERGERRCGAEETGNSQVETCDMPKND
jgi:hypothetical protein